MITFMLLFFPAVIATAIFEAVTKTRLSRRQWLYRFCCNALLINSLCFLVKYALLGTADAPLYSIYTDITPHAAVNYLVMAIPGAVGAGFVQVLLKKTVKVEVEEDEK